MNKHTTILAAALAGVTASTAILSLFISNAPAAVDTSLDLASNSYVKGLSIEEMKPRLAKALRCTWGDEEANPTPCAAKGYFDVELRDTENGILIGTHYVNPDDRHSFRETRRERERAIRMVTTLFPSWKEARTWLTATLEESEASHIYYSAVRISAFWIVVEHISSTVSGNGATELYVTDDSAIIRRAAGDDE
jgi:hypothetical protein